MKKEYRIVTKSGNEVTQFPTKQEADEYLTKKSQEDYKIKEVRVLSFIDFLVVVVLVVIWLGYKGISSNT